MKKTFIVCVSILLLSGLTFAQNETKSCPTIQITAPTALTNPGETMTFSVNAGDDSENLKLKYERSVSVGTIIEGQNTSQIKVAITGEMANSTIATKVFIRDLPPNCLNEALENAAIAPTTACLLLDDYGKVSSGIEKSMLDGFFAQLLNNPETVAFFRLGREKGETLKQTKGRVKRIIKHAKFREFDVERLVFAVDKSETNSFGYLTSAYLIPKNNKLPECENCEIIKGENVK